MDGPGLPKAVDGDCGTILLVAEGVSLKIVGMTTGIAVVLLHIALGRMFR